MGAWGTGIFDNDAALDLLDDISEITNLKAYFLEALNDAIESDYLDSHLGSEILVVAALIDAAVNDTKYPELLEEYKDVLTAIKPLSLSSLKPLALKATEKVLGDESELRELWEEVEEFDVFRVEVDNLINRIK